MLEISGVLIVEDEFVIGLDAQHMLEQHGVTSVHLATTLAEAEEALRTITPISVAMLDFRLGADRSDRLAAELARRGIPFIVTTGYGDQESLPPPLSTAPRLSKPYTAAQVIAALAACHAGRPDRAR